jgi:hypothetical protein
MLELESELAQFTSREHEFAKIPSSNDLMTDQVQIGGHATVSSLFKEMLETLAEFEQERISIHYIATDLSLIPILPRRSSVSVALSGKFKDGYGTFIPSSFRFQEFAMNKIVPSYLVVNPMHRDMVQFSRYALNNDIKVFTANIDELNDGIYWTVKVIDRSTCRDGVVCI